MVVIIIIYIIYGIGNILRYRRICDSSARVKTALFKPFLRTEFLERDAYTQHIIFIIHVGSSHLYLIYIEQQWKITIFVHGFPRR